MSGDATKVPRGQRLRGAVVDPKGDPKGLPEGFTLIAPAGPDFSTG